MATFRIKLSDATTTIDLYSGSDSILRNGGLIMPPPRVRASYTSNPFSDGARLASSNYENREITIITKIKGTSLADLKTNIRTVLRLLNDATQRTLSGFGAQVYLEYQWGDSANESTFFDVLRGDIEMPDDYVNVFLDNFYVRDARIRLTGKPFGRYTNQDIAQATIENNDSGTFENFMDITTTEAFGDVPAKMYIKAVQGNAAGTAKVWITKRSGTRYQDDLWTEGEDESSTTDIVDASHGVTFSDETLAASSGGKFKRARLQVGGEAIGGTTNISRLNYVLSTMPKGQFRILNYCRTTETSVNTEFTKMKWGIGWSYGDKTYTPTVAKDEFYGNLADNVWEVLDLGLLNLPPIAESDIASNNNFELRLFQHAGTSLIAPPFVSPSSATDASSAWSNDAQAWNDVIGNYANASVAAGKWSGTMEFILGTAISCGGVKYYCSGDDVTIDQIDIDGYYDGSWNDMYEDTFIQNTWGTVLFTDGMHTMGTFRVSLFNSDSGGHDARIHDVDFQDGEATSYQWDSDYLFLLPVDEGAVIIDSITPTDALAIDNITDPPNVYTIAASGTILNYPDYVGSPFTLGRENTRLYFLRNDGTAMTFTVDVKYQPQFMVV